MCYHVSTPTKQDLKEFMESRNLDITVPDYESYYHTTGFSHPALPATTNKDPHLVQPIVWGLLPHWAKDTKLADQTLNAISEEAYEKPSFKDSIRQRRCLIWVDGFFEWKHEGKEKVPHYLYMPGHKPFAFGGVWSDWRNPDSGVMVRTCSILTTSANELMATIHNSKKRMPLILDQKDWGLWFDDKAGKEDLMPIMAPYHEGELIARKITKRITSRGASTNLPEVQQEAPKSGLF